MDETQFDGVQRAADGLRAGMKAAPEMTRTALLYDPSYGQGGQLMDEAAQARALRAPAPPVGANGVGVQDFKGGLRNWAANHLEGAKIDASKNYGQYADEAKQAGQAFSSALTDSAEGGTAAQRLKALAGASRVLAPVGVAMQGAKDIYDVATTPTEQYYRRFGWDSTQDDAHPIAQESKNFGVRFLGAMSDSGRNMVKAATLTAVDPGKYYRDLQQNSEAQRTSTGRIPQTAAGPQFLDESASAPKLQEGAPFKSDGISPEMQQRLEARGFKFDKPLQQQAQDTVGASRMQQLGDVRGMAGQGGEDLYVQRKPGQSPLFTNVSPFKDAAEQQAYAQATNGGKNGLRSFQGKGGTVSTIQTPGVEGYMRQLNIIRSLRDPEPAGGRGNQVSVIGDPGWAGRGRSPQDVINEAIGNLPRDMSAGHKAEAVAQLLGAGTAAKRATDEAAYQQGELRNQARGQDLQHDIGLRTNSANRMNALLQRDFEMQRLQMEQGNKNWEFGLQQNRLGLDQQKNQFDQQQAATKNITDRLGSMYTTKDKDGKVIPDADKVADRMRSLNSYLGERAAGLSAIKPNDPRYSQAQEELNLIRTKGVAGLDEQHLNKLLAQKDMQERVQQTHSAINPFASTYVESHDPSSYDIVGLRKGLMQDRYQTRNGSEIPVNDTRYTEPANALLPDLKVRTDRFDTLKTNGVK